MAKSSSADLVLEAAYRCFCRYGYRHTSISDIAYEIQLSSPTVYKYLGGKKNAAIAVVRSKLHAALVTARQAMEAVHPPDEKVLALLTTKLAATIRLWEDSPAHAGELMAVATTAAPGLLDEYRDDFAELLVLALGDAQLKELPHLASVLLAFVRGLEGDLRNVDAARRDLVTGVRLIILGATSQSAAALPTSRLSDGPTPATLTLSVDVGRVASGATAP